jgi:hypothetical protein
VRLLDPKEAGTQSGTVDLWKVFLGGRKLAGKCL